MTLTINHSDWVPQEYTREIIRSYWLLFGYDRESAKWFESEWSEWIWRYRRRELSIDPRLREVSLHPPIKLRAWQAASYPYFWPRIVALHNYLDATQPEGLREVLRDRRDQNRKWTLQ